MSTLYLIGTIAVVALVMIALVGIAFSRFYRRATKQTSFVRTGKGGEKVVMDGGALVLPILHEIIPINMQTLKLSVIREQEEALITKDRLRVDVAAEFYVRVQPNAQGIANAAQTLGQSTLEPKKLADQIEGKFVDALRSVAAKMDMDNLHENRSDFVQQVQETLNEDLTKNGLELESVSLTGLDQTSTEHFDPNNAFDAEGLKKLTGIIEGARKVRNDIERETEVAIAERDLEASKKTLDVKREQEYAEMSTEREISNRRASQMREIAEIEATEDQAAAIARINANKAKEQTEIDSERELEERRIEKQRIIDEKRISKEQATESAEINKRRAIELAEADKQIELANKSKSESEATADAERARADAVEASEEAITIGATARAQRDKQIAIINEEAEAEKEAAKIRVSASAEKAAAQDRADALLVEANAAKEADERRAMGDAFRIRTVAEARAIEYQTEAEGKAKINEAASKLPQAERDMQIKLALVNNMSSIVAEAAKPIGEIDSIRVVDMRGLEGLTNAAGVKMVDGDGKPITVTGGSSGNMVQDVVDGLMKYKVQMPLLTELLGEAGIDLSKGVSNIPSVLSTASNVTDSVDVDNSIDVDVETTVDSSKTRTPRTAKKSANS